MTKRQYQRYSAESMYGIMSLSRIFFGISLTPGLMVVGILNPLKKMAHDSAERQRRESQGVWR
jgi:hypothetical protein